MRIKHKVSFVLSTVFMLLALIASVCFIILQAEMPMDADLDDASPFAAGLVLAIGISLFSYGLFFWVALISSVTSALLALTTAGAEFSIAVRRLSRIWVLVDFFICAAISVSSLIS